MLRRISDVCLPVLMSRPVLARLITLAFATALGVASPVRAQRSPAVPVAPRPGVGPLQAAARPYAIAYTVAMPDPASHLYEIGMEVRGALPDTLRLVLPVWSPGRYARVDFARNVQEFGAEDGAGRALRWTKLGGSTWGVLVGGASAHVAPERVARVRYRVFADDLSGTYSVLDTAHANWNGAGLFVYADGHKPDPVTLAIRPPAGWAVVNGPQGNPGRELPTSDGTTAFRFPNYDELVDAPTEVVPAVHMTIDTFSVDGRRYRVMLHHNGPLDAGVRRHFVDGARAIVARENRVIAPPPLAQYTFLAHAGYGGGDGMEHLTSTEIITARPLADSAAADRFLGTVAHEYFHTWNVKRVRPVALGPFDYTEAQHEPSLWAAEGWTQYYGEMTPVRVGIVSRAAFYDRLARTLRAVATSPARLERSPRAASFDAPFFDGARAAMQVNSAATFVSYYTAGEARALALDLMIRGRSDGGRSLDDVLRALKRRTWDAPRATYYLDGRGYTEDDVERAASEVAGTELHGWFDRYVGGTDDLPWAELLRAVGLTLTTGGSAWTIAEDPAATARAVALRDAWLR
ncbi:peptidase M61 [Gemmatimonadetes bacterium T265]|nr:peptidase M61 [Gemmatimonadetes bacterium T265]